MIKNIMTCKKVFEFTFSSYDFYRAITIFYTEMTRKVDFTREMSEKIQIKCSSQYFSVYNVFFFTHK